MKKVSIVILCIIALVAFAMWAPTDTEAFPGFDDDGGAGVPPCADCHPDLADRGPDHDAHADLSNSDCNSCHENSGGPGNNNPPLANCVRCHGRDDDGNPSADFSAGIGRGLRQHHVTVDVAACGNCHEDTVNAVTGSAPEDTVPSFYPLALDGVGLDPCDGSEEIFDSNSFSLDNDGDGLTDGADPDCMVPAEICDDNIDNDEDGFTDCDDQDCADDPSCLPEVETDCTDGIDNDGDGFVDCADPDCAEDPSCLPEADCADGIDNDGDGATDCDDADCAEDPSCLPEADCADGIDNDGDGATDCDDADCTNDPACVVVPEICDNGVDDDGDGAVDCDDADWKFATMVSTMMAMAQLTAMMLTARMILPAW
jgi:cytochrome c553